MLTLHLIPNAVQLATAKKDEDGNGWILRLWEITGNVQNTEVGILGSVAGSVILQPWQILTERGS